jgi:LPS-assembly protein
MPPDFAREGSPVHRNSLRLLPLCLAIAGAVRAEDAAEPTWLLCANPQTLPLLAEPTVDPGERTMAVTDISADTLDVKKAESTTFSGNVELVRSDQVLHTDKLTYLHEPETFSTEGDVRYQDRGIRLLAKQANGDQKADTLSLKDVQYQFNDELGNGTAKTATMTGQVGELTGATYSTCPPGQRQWEFAASEIKVDDVKKVGVARNATLRIGKVPVLWLPIVSFPTTDERRTGVLSPTVGRDDQNGFDIKIPYYFNLNPSYDATLTPRWLSKRGLMLGGEFRYLGENFRGGFEGTYLPNDDLQSAGEQQDRWLVEYEHFHNISRNWRAVVDFNRVSDVDYFADFGDSLADSSVSFLSSSAGFYGRGRHWDASLSVERYQIANPLLSSNSEPYRRLPRLQGNWYKPLTPWMTVGMYGEAVRFDHEPFDVVAPTISTIEGGQRTDLRPYLNFDFGGDAWFLRPQLAWRHTTYSLDGLLPAGTERSDTRSMPILSLDAGAYFERDTTWGGRGVVQTLEPRLFYLRVPYRDQADLPLFDTRELTFGWTSLFRDNRFGGADRQADANQVAVALTSRFLSAEDGRERLSMSLGRIHYFDEPRVDIPGGVVLSPDGSAWVAEADVSVSERWKVGVTQVWDPDTRLTELSSIRSQYRWGSGGVFNASYRYRRDPVSGSGTGLEQTDLSFVIPVSERWNLLGRWNHSLRDNQTLEALGGFEWKSCCVKVRLLARQYIRSFDRRENFGLYLEIELNGLGSFGRDTERLLDNAILGYSR